MTDKKDPLKGSPKKRIYTKVKQCPDCGEFGVERGHWDCQYPQDIPDNEGISPPWKDK